MNGQPCCADDKLAAVRTFAAFARGEALPEWPLELFLEVSNVCDLRCAMCLRFSALNPDRRSMIRAEARGFMGLELIRRSVEEILPHVLVVNVFGYGEPTIHPAFPELLRLLAEYGVLVEFFTSGMHLDEDLVELLVGTGVHRLTLSFSGASRKEYERVYLGGDFDRVLGGLARLRDRRAAASTSYPMVEVNSLSFRHHLKALDRFVGLMAAHGVAQVNLTPLHEHPETIPALRGHGVGRGSLAGDRIVERALRLADQLGLRLVIHPTLTQPPGALAQPSHRDHAPAASSSRRPEHGLREFPELARRLAVRARTSDAAGGGDETHQFNESTPRVPAIDPQTDQLPTVRELLRMRRIRELADHGAEFVCMEPFKSLYVRRNGEAKACCFMVDEAPALGQLERFQGSVVWRGAGFRAVRHALLNGEYPLAGCAYCLLQQQAPPSHGLERRLAEWARWLDERHGATEHSREARRIAVELEMLGNGRSVVDRLVLAASPLLLDQEMQEESRAFAVAAVQRDTPGCSSGQLLEGFLDPPAHGMVTGWVWAPQRQELRFAVTCTVEGRVVGDTVAHSFRQDLLEAGKGDGRYAFSFDLPAVDCGVDEIEVRVTLSGTRCQLEGSPRRFGRSES